MSRSLEYWKNVLQKAADRFCLDTETTGFGKQALVVQLGYCSSSDQRYDSHLLNWTKYGFEKIVDPEWLKARLDDVAYHMNAKGLTFPVTFEKLVTDGINPINVLRGYRKKLERQMATGGYVAGHNVIGFDLPLLQKLGKEFLGNWVDVDPDRVLDTSVIERSLQIDAVPNPGEKLGAFSRRILYKRLKGVSSSLGDHCVRKYRLAEKWGLDLSETHTAGFDSMLVCILLKEYEQLTPLHLKRAHDRVAT